MKKRHLDVYRIYKEDGRLQIASGAKVVALEQEVREYSLVACGPLLLNAAADDFVLWVSEDNSHRCLWAEKDDSRLTDGALVISADNPMLTRVGGQKIDELSTEGRPVCFVMRAGATAEIKQFAGGQRSNHNLYFSGANLRFR